MDIAQKILDGQDKDGMLRRALERIIQLYTDKSHFVYELLQNAEDAGASRVQFVQYENRLEVLHDGRPFSVENLQGLCDIGKSDKADNLNQIGEFGVGFKSVFGICDRVKLFSHPREDELRQGYVPFAVEIRDFTHPVSIDDQEIENGYTTKFIFPYSVGFSFSGFSTIEKLNNVLASRLQNLGITTLLFMKNLQSIDYEIQLPSLKAKGSYLLEKQKINSNCVLVSARGQEGKGNKGKNKSEEVSYLIFSRPVSGLQTGRTIDIAFTLKVKEDGGYEFLKTRYPYISVYFPTETESKLNFIVQGPYRTTPNRSSVPEDDSDNIRLAHETAELFCDSLRDLKAMDRLDYSLINLLPFDEDEFYNAPLFLEIHRRTCDLLREEKLLPCKDGTFGNAETVKIARGDAFSEILTDELLTELWDDGVTYKWLPTFLTETSKKYKDLYYFLTQELEVEVVRPENLRKNLERNTRFLYNQSDEWLIKFYNLYNSVPNAFSTHHAGSNMLSVAFVKTSKGEFIAAYRKSESTEEHRPSYYGYSESGAYLPNVFLPLKTEDEIDEINFVDSNIYIACKRFFTETLHLKQPDEYEYFVRAFKNRYESGECFTDEQHIQDIKKLLFYRLNSKYEKDIDGLISKYLVVASLKDQRRVFLNPHDENVYFPTNSIGMSIQLYYEGIKSFGYVDTEFYAKYQIEYEQLKTLGIRDSIDIGRGVTSGEYYTGNPGRQPEWHARDFWWKLTLDCLGEVLTYIEKHPRAADSMAKSSFIFRFLQMHESYLQGTVYVGGSTPNKPGETSAIIRILTGKGYYYSGGWKGKWLYTESRELVSQKEISKRELNKSLYGEIKWNSNIYDLLGFQKDEIDRMEAIVKDYDELPSETKDHFFEIELQRRYGISSDELNQKYGMETSGRTSNISLMQEQYVFPSQKVKNWDSLRKHAAEILCFANPVEYQYVVRKLRVSRPNEEVRAYLKNMYQVENTRKYACQMCHEVFSNVEMCQLTNAPDLELDPMNLCMCPNCAAEYKKMRRDEENMSYFIEDITELSELDVTTQDPVKIEFMGEDFWFTQTHIAEIKELIALKERAKHAKEKKNHTSAQSENNEIEDDSEESTPGTDVFKAYIGKTVFHSGKKAYATVMDCDEKYIELLFEGNEENPKKFSLELCLQKNWIRLEE